MGEESINISFESLFEIRMLEKKRSELQELSETFFEDVKNYVQEKEKILKMSIENKFSEEEIQKTERQMEQISKMLEELYHTREDKIIKLAVLESKSQTGQTIKAPMLKEESELFAELKILLGAHKSKIMSKYKPACLKIPKTEEKKEDSVQQEANPAPKAKKIRFKAQMPQFLGKQMESYGPFNIGDAIELPLYLADILIKKEKAENIE